MKADVYIQEVIEYRITVDVPDGSTGEQIARAARYEFLETENGVSGSMIGVTDRSFDVHLPDHSEVFDENELSQMEVEK